MENNNQDSTIDIIEKANALIESAKQGNTIEVTRILGNITQIHERSLFLELGRLTRDLHSALNGFHLDVKLADLAEQEIPDAKQRLNYVIDMTDQAAHRTLSAVEKSLPIATELEDQSKILAARWRQFVNKEINVSEFRELVPKIAGFFHSTHEGTHKIRENLSEVLMAQDYQDLTGQIIRRVINLVQDVEDNLVRLIRLSGDNRPKGIIEKPALSGPPVPGVEEENRVNGQDEVDTLLSSLGF